VKGTGGLGWHVIATAGMLLAGSRCAFALNPALDVSQYAHKAWLIRDGFTQGIINSIAQTPDGYLWLGTQFGLARFDGVKNVPWEPPPNAHLPSRDITILFTARDGTLWIGTRAGLVSWKGGRLTQYAELAGVSMAALLEDHEGSIWAGGIGIPTGRLCRIQKGSVQCNGKDGRFGLGVLSLYADQGNLWAGAANGLWRWNPDPPKLYTVPGPVPEIEALAEGDNGALWIVMPVGIQQLVNGKPEPYPLPVSEQFTPTRMLRDHEGGLWIGTSGQGLWHVHQGRIDAFGSSDGLSGERITSLFEDRERNIWVTTDNGLDRFHDFAIPTISLKQGLSNVGSVLAASDGSIWIGGNSGGLTRWNDGQITVYRNSTERLRTRAAQQRPVREVYDPGLPDDGSRRAAGWLTLRMAGSPA